MRKEEIKMSNKHIGAGLVYAYENKNKLKNNVGVVGHATERGITLISLIITIIILLILAGVTLNTIIGENGIFKLASNASKNYMVAQEKENNEIAKIDDYIENSRSYVTDEELKKQKTMSEIEHFTGEYYYNGKPIYAKTIYISSLPNNTEKFYNHGVENIDMVWVDMSNSFYCYENTSYSATHLHTESNGTITILVNKNAIRITTTYDRSRYYMYTTIKYTKTTDVSNGISITPTQAN